jgi:hypothetical protein
MVPVQFNFQDSVRLAVAIRRIGPAVAICRVGLAKLAVAIRRIGLA